MPEPTLKCVLLADRHHGLSEGLRGLLETTFDTVVMVADEASLLAVAVRLQPQAAVVDLSLGRHQGLHWLRSLRQSCPDLALIVLSVHDEASVRQAALEAGADEFVLKRAAATELLPAIDLALERKHALHGQAG
jgi:two-component system secretion response regulator SsrB